MLRWQEVCAFIRRMVSPIHARYVAAGFRKKMRITWRTKKIELTNMEKIKNFGIGILFVGIGIIIAILMVVWLLYNIFISSKG